MEIIPIVLALILLLSLIILTIMAVFAYARHSFARIEDRYHKSRIRNNRGRGLTEEEKQILKKHSSYYNNLEPDSQSHFEQRLRWFIRQKNFIAAGKIRQVTKEMKLYIGSAAIQISFGYPEIYFQSFHSIFIYDAAYLSEYTGKMHHGDVNVKGTISLNWQKIREGFDNPKDGRNLALHEFAHAINIENFIKNEEFRFIDASLFHLLKKEMAVVYRVNKRDEFLRSYAFTNHMEFFAVCVEYFFEQPLELLIRHPRLYELLSQVLMQNPLDIK